MHLSPFLPLVILFHLSRFFLPPSDWSSSGSTNPSLPAPSSHDLPVSRANRVLYSHERDAARFVTQRQNRITPIRPSLSSQRGLLSTRQDQPIPLRSCCSSARYPAPSCTVFHPYFPRSSRWPVRAASPFLQRDSVSIWFRRVCVRYRPGTSLPSMSGSAYRPSFVLPLGRALRSLAPPAGLHLETPRCRHLAFLLRFVWWKTLRQSVCPWFVVRCCLTASFSPSPSYRDRLNSPWQLG